MSEEYTSMTDPRDWRGVPILVGGLVIYGAPVGRSIAMVEGTVVGFTKSGRVNIQVIRRAYGGWGGSKKAVHVGQDRLTCVDVLPTPLRRTDAELRAEAQAEHERSQRRYESHGAFEREPEGEPDRWGRRPYREYKPCARCGIPWNEARQNECTG